MITIICTILAPSVLAVVVIGIVQGTGSNVFGTIIPLVGVASTTLPSSGAAGRCRNNKEHQHHGNDKWRSGSEKLHDVTLEERRKRTRWDDCGEWHRILRIKR